MITYFIADRLQVRFYPLVVYKPRKVSGRVRLLSELGRKVEPKVEELSLKHHHLFDLFNLLI